MKYHAVQSGPNTVPGAAHPGALREARRENYWRATRRLTAWLLLAWFLITFPMIFFARQLARVVLFGWPLSFYVAARGAILVYVAIIGFYAWRMQRLDREFGRESGHEPGQNSASGIQHERRDEH